MTCTKENKNDDMEREKVTEFALASLLHGVGCMCVLKTTLKPHTVLNFKKGYHLKHTRTVDLKFY